MGKTRLLHNSVSYSFLLMETLQINLRSSDSDDLNRAFAATNEKPRSMYF